MVVITTSNGVIMAIGTNLSQSPTEPDVLMLDGAGYGVFGQKHYDVATIPAGVTAGLYTYDGKAFAPYKSEQDRIAQDAVDKYTLELMTGGIL